MLAQVAFLAVTLIHFCPCHVVAYLAAPVIAKPAGTSVKHPAFTDPPDHTEILQIIQILQIVQTASRLRCTGHSDHINSIQVDHRGPADHTDSADHIYPADHTDPTG